MSLDLESRSLADHLRDMGPLRVWSLIVTILGDAVELRGGVIATARLSLILDRLGIRLPAQRTALSRLVRDGWIERLQDTRDGRASLYRFSAKGRAEFDPAARLIYAAPGTVTDGAWIVTPSPDPRGIPMAPGVGLWPAQFAPREAGLCVAGEIALLDGTAPRISAAQEAEQQALFGLLEAISDLREGADGLDALAARIAVIHGWRRHVLRFPEWPALLVPEASPGLRLRGDVAAAYLALLPASDAWLSTAQEGLPGLPKPGPDHALRFRGKPEGAG